MNQDAFTLKVLEILAPKYFDLEELLAAVQKAVKRLYAGQEESDIPF